MEWCLNNSLIGKISLTKRHMQGQDIFKYLCIHSEIQHI